MKPTFGERIRNLPKCQAYVLTAVLLDRKCRSYIWVETAPHHSESAQESCGQQQTDFDTESTQFQYELWDGVVFRKDLATRKMPRAINWYICFITAVAF